MQFPILLLQVSQILPAPVCMILVWTVLGSLSWLTWATLRSGWQHLRRLHQIPCDRCAFSTGEYHLQCSVHPCKAFTEESLNCLDFEPCCSSHPVHSSTHGMSKQLMPYRF